MIDKNLVISMHDELVAGFGGCLGVRDETLLESALARFGMVQAYNETADIFDCIAALVYSLVKNHPFIDGNKRTGVAVCEVLMNINGHTLDVQEEEEFVVFIDVAAGGMTEAELAAWLRASCYPLPRG
ncbi:MAG: type II toxin-antitoxin system death-on-curing family toxin [Rickettsiales bacterium]|jgi:death-on-curing protein|nr:type II toxin-antitoxin system death-on-curing family toxin [Rickettsiales bacterium]